MDEATHFMTRKTSVWFLFSLFLIGNIVQTVSAQDSLIPEKPRPVKPKIDSTIVGYFNGSFDSLSLGYTHYVDTNLLFVTRFDPLSRQVHLQQTLSNAGLAHQSLCFEPVFNHGVGLLPNPFRAYIFTFDDISYLQPTAALTEIGYMMGSKKEQQLNVLFGRQVAPNTFVGMDFRLIDSKGPYKNNATNNSAVYFTARYNTKNKRYGVLGHYLNSKINVNENGGIMADSIFEKDLEFDRRVIGVNLENAVNQYKLSGFGFEQYFILLSEKRQTSDSTSEKRRFQLGRIVHQFEYQRIQSVYSERNPLSDFYKNFDPVINNKATYDSSYQSLARNRFYWSSLGYNTFERDVPLHVYGGLELVSGRMADSIFSKGLWQVNPFGGINISLFRSFYVNGQVKLITGSESSGDLELYGKVRQFLGTESRNLGHLFFSFRLINQSPSWFMERYRSNHFRWDNNFGKTTFVSFRGGYQIKGLEGGAEWHIVDKYLFLNSQARPQQTNGTAKIYRLFGNLHFKPGKFDVLANLNYQYTDNDTLFSLPALSARLRFTFSQLLIKDVATFQTGLESYWFTSYYADAYMPALKSFYPQREKKVGNYPFVDVFIALKVKRARIFGQFSNAFGLLKDYRYYTTPHYPMRDARFYVGVSWRFYQ